MSKVREQQTEGPRLLVILGKRRQKLGSDHQLKTKKKTTQEALSYVFLD